MAQVPIVGPEVGIQPAEPVGVQRINLTRPNPALTELHEQAAKTNGMLAEMGDALAKQKLNSEIQNANADRINADTASIIKANDGNHPDPNEKQQFLTSEFNQNAAAIVKAHPSIPALDGEMNLQTARQLQELQFKTIAEKHQLALEDIKATHQKTLVALGNTDDPGQIESLKNNYAQYLQNSVNNGVIHQQQAEELNTQFNYEATKQNVTKLIATKPEQAQQELLANGAGLTPEDRLTALREANARVTYNLEAPDRAVKVVQEQNRAAIENGKYNPANAWNDLRANKITENDYKMVMGHPPSNDGLRNKLSSEIDPNTFTGDQAALDNWRRNNYIPSINDLAPEDREAVSNTFGLTQKKVSSTMGKDLADKTKDLKQFNIKTNASVYMIPTTMGNPMKLQLRNEEANIIKNMQESKSIAERTKILNEGKVKLQELGKSSLFPSMATKPVVVPSKSTADLMRMNS